MKATSEQIYSFCCDLKGNSDESQPMVIDLLEGNDYKPVIVKKLENKMTLCQVAIDHNYLQGKRKTWPEVPPEVDHSSPCKKQKLIISIHGNECEPFDSNFLNDSHLLISHSVLIAPEDNPNGDQKNNLQQIARSSLRQKLLVERLELCKMETLVLWEYLINAG